MPMRLQFIDSLIGYEVGGKRSGVGDIEYNLVYNDDYILFQDATTDLLTIRFKNDIPYNTELQIFNSYGQKIPGLSHASEPGTNRIEIDVSSLSSGVYFAELSGSGKVRTIPFIVMR